MARIPADNSHMADRLGPITPPYADDPLWVVGRFRSVAGWPMMIVDTSLWARHAEAKNCVLDRGL